MSGRDDYEERRNMHIARFNAAHKMAGAKFPTTNGCKTQTPYMLQNRQQEYKI